MSLERLSFDIDTLSEGYAKGAFRVADILREALRRIESGDPKIWISLDSEGNLMGMAEELEASDSSDLPLYGIPFAVKDNIDVANLATTAACPDYRFFSNRDATVVARLRAAGAIPIGKTNLDQFATGLVGVRSPYGVPGNAFDPEYIPGGSSSGSAVAVALGQVSFSLGTDTAGSGRVPACFNNLVGLKPTRGLLSNSGVVPACKSLDCVSIFSLNAHDAQKAFQSAQGFDRQDPYSRKAPASINSIIRTFGVPEPAQLEFFGDTVYQEAYLKAVKRLEEQGYAKKVVDIHPFLEAARLLYEGPWVSERYWAIKDVLENSPDSVLPVTRSIIEKGANGTSVDTFDAFYKLEAFKQAADEVMSEIDFLVTPTAGTHYKISEIENDPIQLNSNLGYYTNYLNLLDYSAVATPTEILDTGRPFGITLVGDAFADEALLRVADKLQRASDVPLGTSNVKRFPELQAAPPEDSMDIVVCGAHMSGLPLNHQLTDLGAVLSESRRTAACYRLFALPNTTPPKPGMIRDENKGGQIEVEVWKLPKREWGAFIAQIPPPLGIASIELENGSYTKGFACEAWAIEGAEEVTQLGSWRKRV